MIRISIILTKFEADEVADQPRWYIKSIGIIGIIGINVIPIQITAKKYNSLLVNLGALFQCEIVRGMCRTCLNGLKSRKTLKDWIDAISLSTQESSQGATFKLVHSCSQYSFAKISIPNQNVQTL